MRDTYYPAGVGRRLVEMLLPQGGYVMALWEAYFDESGTHEGSNALAVGGYLLLSDQAVVIDEIWEHNLRRFRLPYFHMVDCAHGVGAFGHLWKSQRVEAAASFIELIKATDAIGFTIVTNPRRFHPGKDIDAYSRFITLSAGVISNLARRDDPDAKVALFIEDGHPSRPKVSGAIANLQRDEFYADFNRTFSSHIFAKKADVRLLQAADLLLWQTTKFIKCKIEGRPVRKDYLSLMEGENHMTLVTADLGIMTFGIYRTPGQPSNAVDTAISAIFSGDDDAMRHFHAQVAAGIAKYPRGR